jgi:hypothetical protein
VAIPLPVGADDKPAKVNHLRRFSFCAPHFGVMRALSVYLHKKTARHAVGNPVVMQAALRAVKLFHHFGRFPKRGRKSRLSILAENAIFDKNDVTFEAATQKLNCRI